jgi:hypothetical protein
LKLVLKKDLHGIIEIPFLFYKVFEIMSSFITAPGEKNPGTGSGMNDDFHRLPLPLHGGFQSLTQPV